VLATDVDHVVPVSGPDDPRFLDFGQVQSLCHPCHSRKSALEDSTFVKKERTA
jgi:5-methylcytosine-specific restriction protein A